jgi:hypothetical protein
MSLEDSIEDLDDELYPDTIGDFVDGLLSSQMEERLSGDKARVMTLPDHPACQPVEFFIEGPKLSEDEKEMLNL